MKTKTLYTLYVIFFIIAFLGVLTALFGAGTNNKIVESYGAIICVFSSIITFIFSFMLYFQIREEERSAPELYTRQHFKDNVLSFYDFINEGKPQLESDKDDIYSLSEAYNIYKIMKEDKLI
jgi:hypothetical protein